MEKLIFFERYPYMTKKLIPAIKKRREDKCLLTNIFSFFLLDLYF